MDPASVERPRIGRNAIWAFAGFAWPTLLMIVAIPLYLGALGVRGFGLWSIGLALLGAGGSLHLGLGEATVKYVASHWARSEREEATRVVWGSLSIYACIGAVASILLWIGSAWIAARWFHLEGRDLQEASTLFRIIAIGLPAMISLQAVLGVFDGLQRFHVSQSLILLKATLQVAGGIAAVTAGTGVRGLAIAYVAGLWSVWVIGLVLGISRLPRVGPGRLRFRATVRKLFSFGVFSSLTSFGHMAVQQLDKVVIGSLVGLDAVAYYSIPQSITFKIGALCHAVSRVLLPFFSSRQKGIAGARLGEPVFASWRLVIMLALGLGAGIAASSPWLLALWAGAEVAGQSLPVYWVRIAVYTLNAAVYVIPHNYLSAVGRPDLLARNTLVAGSVTLVMQAVLAYFFGVVGGAAGALFYPLCQLMLIHVVVVAMEGRSPADTLLGGLTVPALGALSAIALGVASGVAGDRLAGTAWGGLLASLVVCGLVLLLFGLVMLARRVGPYGEAVAVVARRMRS